MVSADRLADEISAILAVMGNPVWINLSRVIIGFIGIAEFLTSYASKTPISSVPRR